MISDTVIPTRSREAAVTILQRHLKELIGAAKTTSPWLVQQSK